MSADKPSMQVPIILWVSFLITHGVFLVMGFTVHGQGGDSPADIEVLSIVLTGVGAVTALGSVLAIPILLRQTPWFSLLIIRFALAETASIFGLILAMLGADMQWTYILTGLGVVALLSAFPSERDREEHERRGEAR